MRLSFKSCTRLILATLLLLSMTTLPATPVTDMDPVAAALAEAEGLIGQKKGQRALAALDAILEQYPQHRPTLYTKAKLLAGAQRFDEAQEIVDVLLQEDPPATVVLHVQGYIYSRRGLWAEALEYYELAYPHGHDSRFMNTMTQTTLRVRGPDAAIDFLSAHLLEYPAENNIRLLRAKLYQRQHRFSAALEDYEFVKAAQPENPVAWKNLADMFIAQRDKRAIPHAREAVRLAPAVAEVNDTLGRALLEFGEAAEALQVLSKAHETKPGDAGIAYDYALALAANQNEEQARKVMTGLAEPDSPVGIRARTYLENSHE